MNQKEMKFTETAALLAVMEKDWKKVRMILADMSERELSILGRQCEDLVEMIWRERKRSVR